MNMAENDINYSNLIQFMETYSNMTHLVLIVKLIESLFGILKV